MRLSLVGDASSASDRMRCRDPQPNTTQRDSLKHTALNGMSLSSSSTQKSKNPLEEEAEMMKEAGGDRGPQENKAL